LAAIIAILKALGRVIKRDLGTLRSIQFNNFFLFAMLLTYSSLASSKKPAGATPFLVLLGFVLLFPLSSDPLSKIPAVRLGLWPLTRGQWWKLRLASLGLSPVLWAVMLVLATTSNLVAAGVLLVMAVVAQSFLVLVSSLARRAPGWNPYRYVPQLPGALGGLIRNNVRQMLTVLDLYVAILVAIAGSAYRWLSAHPEPRALPIMAFLVGLALSTYAQCLFGLDSASGLTRYRLLPLRGWQILLAKDIAFLGILFVLVLPLSPGAGLAFGLVAVAVGRYPSVALRLPQKLWRFTSGDFRFGVLQMVLGTALGFAVYENGKWFFVAVAVAYVVSLFGGGWLWDRQHRRNAKNSGK
jgi:hypothetical protein